jgi:hypothetical protein
MAGVDGAPAPTLYCVLPTPFWNVSSSASGRTLRLYVLEATHPVEFVAVTVTMNAPVVVGEPVRTPPLDRLSPAGRLPAVTANVCPAPPLALNANAYAASNVAAGSAPAGGDTVHACTVRVKSCVAGVPTPLPADSVKA